MSEVNGKYLKDESGNTISPITSFSTVFDSGGWSLEERLSYRAHYLYRGSMQEARTFTLGDNGNVTGFFFVGFRADGNNDVYTAMYNYYTNNGTRILALAWEAIKKF